MPPQTPPGNEPTDATPSPETPSAQAADAPAAAPEGNPAEPSTQPPAEQPSAPAPAVESPPSEPSNPAPADEKPALAADEPSAPPAEPQPAAAEGDKPSDGQVPVTAAKPAGDVPTIEPTEMPDETPVARSAARPSVPTDDVPKEELPAPPDAEQPSVLGAPRFAMADVAKAAGVASQELQAAQAAKDEAALKRARTQFYLKMFAMAEALTFAKDEAGGQLGPERQSVEQILLQFASDKKRLDALKYNAGRWLDFSKRTTSGVVVAGTVQSCEPSGQLYEVKLGIGIATDDPVVTVLHKSDPHLAQGDQALLLGAIVDNPIEKVSGYEGLEPMAIWSGMTMKLPAAK
jgi:hypothetical protein